MIKKIFSSTAVLSALLLALAGTSVSASTNDSSVTLKKPAGTEYFNLTISDPDGIQEFSLSPVGRYNYGGGISGCPRSFSSTNVAFIDPGDFTPAMPAYVIDCQNNTTKLEIAPPKNGVARSKLIVPEEEKKPTPPPAPPEATEGAAPIPKEEKKNGPLSASDIQYPVPGLGDCKSEAECRTYCDNSQHGKECFVFAKKYNLITEKEAKEAEKHFFDVTKGPGGCNSGTSCETYCNNVDHLDECIDFAEKSGYYSGDQLAEAKKFQELVKAGKKFPGGCKNRNECELYCNGPEHMEECLNFAEESGFMPKEEIAEARRILPLMKKGETPGGCTSKEQCEKYCIDDSHANECIAFAEKAGLISSEDAAMAKKTGGKGPGGCRSKTQCDSYCEKNSDECFKWAQDKGLINEADLDKMKKGMSQFKEQLDKVPPEVTQCLKDAVGEKNFEKLANGQPVFDRSMEGKMKSCFNQITSQFSKQINTMPPEAVECIKNTIGEEGLKKLQSGQFDENIDFGSLEGCFQKLQQSFGGRQGGPGGPGGPGGGGFSGPGGCKSIDECTDYCQTHMDECQQFTPPGVGGGNQGGPGDQGGGRSNYSGPGGCKSQEECTAYCQEKEHQDECQKFIPPGGGGGNQGGGQGGSGNQQQGGGSSGGQGSGGQGGFQGGPGGCKSQEECMAYCKDHYNTDPACGNGGGGGSRAVCDYARPPEGCTFTKGPGYNSETNCGLELSCPNSKTPPTPNPTPTPPPYGGPGGCKSQEECMAYCQSHYNTDPACGGGGGGAPTPMPPPSPQQAQTCAPIPPGLVMSWNGDSLSGASGGASVAPGKVGNAFKFDGSSGYINAGNPGNLNFGTGPFSLEAWFNWTGGGNYGALNIIRKSNYGPDPGSGYWVRIGREAKTIEFSIGATVKPQGQTLISASISPNAWHHVVATRDASDNVKLYIDGESQGNFLRQYPKAESTSPSSFAIGGWDDQHSEFFPGLIDEVSVYSRALDASEIQTIFNAGSAGKCFAR